MATLLNMNQVKTKGGQLTFKYRIEKTLSGAEKSDWIAVPSSKKGLFIEFATRFLPTGSMRILTTWQDTKYIKLSTTDADDVKYNIWPKGTISEADVDPNDDYASDVAAATFTAFRIESLSGDIITEVVTN